ncbi:MAG: hypothetical protein ABI666_09630 [Ferruginibacter sp.]
MRYYFILLILFLFSCKDSVKKVDKPKGWTEEQKRNYFADNFAQQYGFGQFNGNDSTKTFSHFFVTQYPDIKTGYSSNAFPYAFEEEYIDTTKIDSSRHWFRLIVKPCFRNPYCFIVEKKNKKVFLTTKITNGNGGTYTGVLIATLKFQFDDTLYDNISRRLSTSNFWKLGIDTTCHGGFDGETWTFEALENGKYNFIWRWVPQDCGDGTTINLSKIGLQLGKLSGLDDILTALGAPKSGL